MLFFLLTLTFQESVSQRIEKFELGLFSHPFLLLPKINSTAFNSVTNVDISVNSAIGGCR